METNGTRLVAWFDCPGGGQVVVRDGHAFVGHMRAPLATSIIDVSDPKRPRGVAQVSVAEGLHAHKVQVANGLMLTNREAVVKNSPEPGGLVVHDVSDPSQPRELARWTCGGSGVHRFTFDGRYAYISPEVDGYVGNIVMILDFQNPEAPQEVGRWWMPGQWTGGGEVPSWKGRQHRCHHAIRHGDRLNVSYWHGGGVILDVSDLARPREVSRFGWSPPYPWPIHSLVQVPFPILGRRWMIVADEDVDRLDPEMAAEMSAPLWFVDVTDETRPTPVSSFQVAGVNGRRNPDMTGCHQPVETVIGTEIPVAWFAQGLRFVDFSNPLAPRETASFVPDVAPGADRVSSNDVFVDERGLIYLIDRVRGLSIIERV